MIVESTGAAFIKLGPLPGPRYCKVCGLLEASMISRATIRNDDTKNSMGIVAAASAIGTTIEWYDFLIYATAASLVLNKLFFPNQDPFVGKLLSIGTIGVGFFARPLGAIILSHFGDRIGRKSMLILTLVSMGVATTLIGLLLPYASIGVAAPLTLVACRLVEGIAVGGEWGGAVLMTTEHSPSYMRGFYGSIVQIGFPLGMALGTASFFALAYLSDGEFTSWGWRIPFVASAALVVIGVFIRLRIEETPDFKRLLRDGNVSRFPVIETMWRHPKDLIIGLGARITEISWIYVLTIFGLSYAVTNLGLSRSLVLGAYYNTVVRKSLRSRGPTHDLYAWMRCRYLPFVPRFLGDRDTRPGHSGFSFRYWNVCRPWHHVRCSS